MTWALNRNRAVFTIHWLVWHWDLPNGCHFKLDTFHILKLYQIHEVPVFIQLRCQMLKALNWICFVTSSHEDRWIPRGNSWSPDIKWWTCSSTEGATKLSGLWISPARIPRNECCLAEFPIHLLHLCVAYTWPQYSFKLIVPFWIEYNAQGLGPRSEIFRILIICWGFLSSAEDVVMSNVLACRIAYICLPRSRLVLHSELEDTFTPNFPGNSGDK